MLWAGLGPQLLLALKLQGEILELGELAPCCGQAWGLNFYVPVDGEVLDVPQGQQGKNILQCIALQVRSFL